MKKDFFGAPALSIEPTHLERSRAEDCRRTKDEKIDSCACREVMQIPVWLRKAVLTKKGLATWIDHWSSLSSPQDQRWLNKLVLTESGKGPKMKRSTLDLVVYPYASSVHSTSQCWRVIAESAGLHATLGQHALTLRLKGASQCSISPAFGVSHPWHRFEQV